MLVGNLEGSVIDVVEVKMWKKKPASDIRSISKSVQVTANERIIANFVKKINFSTLSMKSYR